MLNNVFKLVHHMPIRTNELSTRLKGRFSSGLDHRWHFSNLIILRDKKEPIIRLNKMYYFTRRNKVGLKSEKFQRGNKLIKMLSGRRVCHTTKTY